MDADRLRIELFHIIRQANDDQLRDLNVLITDYFNLNKNNAEEWDTMPQFLKDRINEGLRQAEAGLGKPLYKVMEDIRTKYGLY
ncbi:hypothetical protein IDJ77_14125 [Mucilaginibacter sp. ZT4R22]|uniref:Addiction module component n=1 Tax=Mucilaginibacter pankratovii TaxID=2772110 RepID=A0ABR7WRN1_9SPHI|nr:hypothetical protein [Mucilaginibacter pankratovii]MBD1364955.1 hypothetical protein [Mucilaginibacter pankratovii]